MGISAVVLLKSNRIYFNRRDGPEAALQVDLLYNHGHMMRQKPILWLLAGAVALPFAGCSKEPPSTREVIDSERARVDALPAAA